MFNIGHISCRLKVRSLHYTFNFSESPRRITGKPIKIPPRDLDFALCNKLQFLQHLFYVFSVSNARAEWTKLVPLLKHPKVNTWRIEARIRGSQLGAAPVAGFEGWSVPLMPLGIQRRIQLSLYGFSGFYNKSAALGCGSGVDPSLRRFCWSCLELGKFRGVMNLAT